MAELHTYKCKHCGYEVNANPAGYDALMSGVFINFRCNHCKQIVNIRPMDIHGYNITCLECGEDVASTWNPVDGKCPKCNHKMEKTGISMLAD